MITDLKEFPGRGIYVAACPGAVFYLDTATLGERSAALRCGTLTLYVQLNQMAEYGLTWADESTTLSPDPVKDALSTIVDLSRTALSAGANSAASAALFRASLVGIHETAHTALAELQKGK